MQDVCQGPAGSGPELSGTGGHTEPHIQRRPHRQERPAGGTHEPQSTQTGHQIQPEGG